MLHPVDGEHDARTKRLWTILRHAMAGEIPDYLNPEDVIMAAGHLGLLDQVQEG